MTYFLLIGGLVIGFALLVKGADFFERLAEEFR